MLIGASASLHLYWYGRVTGMSGIFNSLIKYDKPNGFNWKYSFFAGLIFIPVIVYFATGDSITSNGKIVIRFFDPALWTEANLNVVG